MLLFNLFSNRLDDLVNIFNKEDIIRYYLSRNTTNPWLLTIQRNKVTNNFKIDEKMKNSNRDIFNISFFLLRSNKI